MMSNPQAVEATSNMAPSPLSSLQERIGRRAGVQLTDDFRSGLHDWAGSGNWSDSWSYDNAGFVRIGQFALYTPSLRMSDYRLEFVGQIDKKCLGWAVRAADLQTYMAVKLMQVKPGPLAQVAILRYAVINGKEDQRKQVLVPFSVRTDEVYRIRVDVTGKRYSVFVQDRIVDTWEDDRFQSGGVGFFSSKGEAARLRSVRITYQYDWVGRICAALAG